MESCPYPYHTYIRKGKQCTEVFIRNLHEFNREIHSYINALLNSCGGIIKVGVENGGYVHGIECRRDTEDNIKLTMDNTVKFFQPKVSPALYRLNFVPCEVTDHSSGCVYDVPDVKVVEIHVSAGTEILYMDKKTQKSMVLHNGKPMLLGPQQIQALAIAKYKQEVLHADTLWDVITPACMKKKESRLKQSSSSSTTVICTQTTPGLAPAATPKPASHSVSIGPDTSNTPCPTPVAELFISPQNTPNTAVRVGKANKRSLSPDSSGTVKRMPARSCKDTPKNTEYIEVIEDSPDIVCLGSIKKANAISISDSSPSTPFASDSNGDTVVKRVLRSSSKINDKLEPSLVKNPSDLFNEESTEERGRSRTRKRHKAGDSSKHKRSKKSSRKRHKSGSDSRERRHRSRSSSKSPETRSHRRRERSRHAESGTRKGKSSETTLKTNEGTMNIEKLGNSGTDAPYGSKIRITGKENKSLESTQKCAKKDSDSVESSKSIQDTNHSRDVEVLQIICDEKCSKDTVDAKKSVVILGKSIQKVTKEKGGYSLTNVKKSCTAKSTTKNASTTNDSKVANGSCKVSNMGESKCADRPKKVNEQEMDAKTSDNPLKPKRIIIKASSPPKRNIIKASSPPKRNIIKASSPPKRNIIKAYPAPKSNIIKAYPAPKRNIIKASSPPKSNIIKASSPPKRNIIKAYPTPKRNIIKVYPTSKSNIIKAYPAPKRNIIKASSPPKRNIIKASSPPKRKIIKASSPHPGSITSVLNRLRNQTCKEMQSTQEVSDPAVKENNHDESIQKSENKCVPGAKKEVGGEETKTSSVVVPGPEKEVSPSLNKNEDVQDATTNPKHHFVVPKRKINEVSSFSIPGLKRLRSEASQRLQSSLQNRNIQVSHPPVFYGNNPVQIRHQLIDSRSFGTHEWQQSWPLSVQNRANIFPPLMPENRWNFAAHFTNPYQNYSQNKPTDYTHQPYHYQQQPYYFGQGHQQHSTGNRYMGNTGGVPHLGRGWQQGTGNTAFRKYANQERHFTGSYNENHLQ